MQRYLVVLVAVALLLTGCTELPLPGPTAVVRPTELPALYTLVPTFTPPAPTVAVAAETPSPVATATAMSSPTVMPTTAEVPTALPTSTVPPTPAPSPTRAPTRPPTRRLPTSTPKPPSAPAPGAAWKGEYFNNPDLNGQPVLVRYDGDVNFDWGLGSPDPSVPTDHFSVRWTRAVSLPAGQWRFHATSDDGVRVYADGILIMDQWHTSGSVTYNTSVALSGGNHYLRLDYYDNVEEARIRLWWEPDDGSATDPAHAGAWRGDYFDNIDLSEDPTFSRDDAVIWFDWGESGPGRGVGNQEFSVRWTRQIFFPSGTYLFKVRADDGVRLWYDWNAIIDQWHDSAGDKTYKLEKSIPEGIHTLAVEYYQRGGGASVQVSWEPTNVDWIANIHTCLRPDDSWVKVYRLAPNDQWQDLKSEGYTADQADGQLHIWGVPLDATFGWDGQPYLVELWVRGKKTASDGDIFAGQPMFRIVPGQDVHTSWPCGAQLPTQ